MKHTPILAGLALLALLGGAIGGAHRPDGNPVVGTVTIGPDPGTLVVDTQTGRAFIGDQSSARVDVLDTATGTRVGAVAPSPAGTQVDDLAADERLGRIFVLSAPGLGAPLLRGYVSMLDARSGRLLRTTPVTLGGALGWLAVDRRARHVFVLGFPDYLPVGTTPDPVRDAVRVSVLDALSGCLVRALTLLLPHQPLQSGAFADSPLGVDQRTGRVFVSRFDGARLSVLDAGTGRLLRRVVVGRNAPRFPPLAVVMDARHGRAFVVARSEGTVGVLDSRSGRVLRTLNVGGRLGGATVDSRTGRLVVTIGDASAQAGTLAGPGLVGVLDGRSGILLRTIRVGSGPRAVAVDERTGHAIVVTSGGTLPAPATWRWLPAWLRQGLPVLPSPGLRTRAIPHGQGA